MANAATFVGRDSPWRHAPAILVKPGGGHVGPGSAPTDGMPTASDDPLLSTLRWLRSSGWMDHDVTVTSLALREPRPRPVVVGRSGTCDVVVDDRSVSRQHASFVPPPRLAPSRRQQTTQPLVPCWHVVDMDSSNGTMVRDRRIQPGVPVPLAQSVDQVVLGTVELLVVDHDLLTMLVCEAISLPWAADIGPDTSRITDVWSIPPSRDPADDAAADPTEEGRVPLPDRRPGRD